MSNQQELVEALNTTVGLFKTSTERAKHLIDKMKNEQVRKVFKAVVDFPMNDSEPIFSRKDENELFVLCVQSNEHKKAILSTVETLKPALEKIAAENLTQELIKNSMDSIPEEEKQDGKVE